MKKFCQSCGMPLILNNEKVNGTNKDGSISETYCYYCYANGAFLEPNITMEQMLEKGTNAIKNGQGNKLAKFLMLKFYPKQLKNLKRWKN